VTGVRRPVPATRSRGECGAALAVAVLAVVIGVSVEDRSGSPASPPWWHPADPGWPARWALL